MKNQATNGIQLKNDFKIDIAIGKHRRDLNWKNENILWSDFVNRLSTTHRTAESFAEYISAKPARQAEIKDVGGFVGGFLTGGKRKASNVLHRSFIALDIDFCSSVFNFWEELVWYYENAAVLYSTHKHSPEAPRLRLLMPLDRTVRPDEYEAIARSIAGAMGIESFDPTTFQSERLMYWPSTSKDGEYVFKYQDAPCLNADKILSTYTDWQDCSSWPLSSKVDKIIQRSIQKQGDPLEKPGVIGAFCRTYNIHEAIETYLPDVYVACDVQNRYSYAQGSTAAGLVTYDDKFAFSHHGTDPISGKLCNAFDLVRIHLFGLKDEDAKEGTPNHQLPSYKAMEDLATKQASVKALLSLEKLAMAKNDFSQVPNEETGEVESVEWMAELEIDTKGNYYTSFKNLTIILENDPGIKNRIGLNEFSHKLEVLQPLPWNKTKEVRLWTNDDWGCLRCYLGMHPYNLMRTPKLEDAMSMIKQNNTFHPIRNYLKSLQWDGEKRVDRLFVDYLGAEDSEYVKAVTRKTLVACVARIYRPGAKFDNVLTLVGRQGTGKSTIIKKLGGEWYSDTFNFNMLHQGKQAFEQIQGVWLVEIGEMVGLKKADVEAAKNFISSSTDLYRPSHEKETVSRKRQCVFFGTTNSPEFLKAANGNRRFWPIDVHVQTPLMDLWKDFTQEVIHQVWAEAVQLYKDGEPLNLSHELELLAMKVQEDHEEIDPRGGAIETYLNKLLPANWDELNTYERRAFLNGDEIQQQGTISRSMVCAAEIFCEAIGGLQRDMTTQNTKFIHDIMGALPGWKKNRSKRNFGPYGRQMGYERCTNNTNNIPTKIKAVVTSKTKPVKG